MPATRRSADGAAVLLRTGDPVREAIVGGDMINLRGWLVVPRTPCGCAIKRNDRALIAGEDHASRIVRINPELVIVVPTRRTFDRRPCFAGVDRAIHRRIHYVDNVCVFWIDSDFLEIPAAVPEALVARELGPRSAPVVRRKHSAFLRIHDRVKSITIRWGD